ncbi:TrmH family RNA methyltransferase [Hyphomonas sp.]|uniref:TrmH family RNA methyltransferase n=1 Tax=Hyphomonas sp. TaxID=87 RepID=UPI00391BA37F
MKNPPEYITSPSNPLIKLLKSLERKKERAETGLFLAEGARIVAEGLARGWHAETVVIAADMADRAAIASIAASAEAAGARVVLVPERLMSKITQKDNAQSVVAAFRQRHLSLADLPAPASGGLYIALFEVRDPGNLGTILRTADCAGLSGVILLGTTCDPYSFEAVRASMGSLFDMPFAASGFCDFDTWRKAAGLSLTAASVNGTVRHDGADLNKGAVILMGNEQAGLPDWIEDACDTLALIPMRGGADSLNLAQASAVMIYEAWRQRGYA